MTTSLDRLMAALADRYRIERERGAGGMATVYLAQDLKHDRKVALKVLKPELAAVRPELGRRQRTCINDGQPWPMGPVAIWSKVVCPLSSSRRPGADGILPPAHDRSARSSPEMMKR
jgi:serine/threonine protein kinase